MLLACHQRIRHFTEIAVRIAEAHDATGPEIANAAEAVHRYFSIALPLHEADENDSVYPRLRRNLIDVKERESLDVMVQQHGPIDEVIARLVPRWEQLSQSPARLSTHAAELRSDASRLQELWREHLALEEQVVFPLIRTRLTRADLEAIHAEMKRRRGLER